MRRKHLEQLPAPGFTLPAGIDAGHALDQTPAMLIALRAAGFAQLDNGDQTDAQRCAAGPLVEPVLLSLKRADGGLTGARTVQDNPDAADKPRRMLPGQTGIGAGQRHPGALLNGGDTQDKTASRGIPLRIGGSDTPLNTHWMFLGFASGKEGADAETEPVSLQKSGQNGGREGKD